VSFKDQMLADFKNVFLNTDEFAETVIFMAADGSTRSIKAVVVRGDIGARDETDYGVMQMMTVSVANDAVNGVTPAQITGREAMFVSWNEGVAADATKQDQKRMLVSIPQQDDGSLTFRFGPRH
jgi:hypothetical protein